jgi:hypothetical protein
MEEPRNAGPYVCDGCGETFNRKNVEPFEAFRAGMAIGTFHSIECWAVNRMVGQPRHEAPSR